jgi:AcrR family transcriptional regulator
MFNIALMPKTAVAKRRRSQVQRSRGRPASTESDDVRAALLDAARTLFLKHGFAKVSSRQIARVARTTPAMIHYYFGDKHGLFREIVTDAIAPFVRQLSSTFADTASQPVDPAALIAVHMRTGASNQWLASLLVNEVLAEGGELRSDFIRHVAQRLAPMLIQTLTSARDRGMLRSDLDPKLAALSFLSLCAFPLISRGVTGSVFGVRLEGADLERLIEHTARLFMRGCAA